MARDRFSRRAMLKSLGLGLGRRRRNGGCCFHVLNFPSRASERARLNDCLTPALL